METQFGLKETVKMKILRDKKKIYKPAGVMFLLVMVIIAIVRIGSSNSRMESQLEWVSLRDVVSKQETQENEYSKFQNFWHMNRQDPEPKTPPEVTRQWGSDISLTNCTANQSLAKTVWFNTLEPNFKQFLLYRHCRHFPLNINHPEKCSEEIYLLIVIKSIITQHDRRELIRQTWGKEQEIDGKKVRTLFLLGEDSNKAEMVDHQKLLEYENQIFGDILQWNFTDSFFNLTLKETHFLKWFSMYCGNVRYIFKGDDDVFVNVPNIFEYLKDNEAKDLFVGDVFYDAKPIRKTENKYYIPTALYDKPLYPPYAGGGGFLMNGPLARKLHEVAQTMELYPIDDVFLGMCLEKLHVIPIKHNAFRTFGLVKKKDSKLNREPCFFKRLIMVHKLLPAELVKMWRLVNSKLVCTRKFEFI